GENLLGVGCTASLATDRPKRGEHRFHLTCHTANRCTTYSLILRKDARTRDAEEAVLDSVLLNAVAEACGIAERLSLSLLSEEMVQIETPTRADPVRSLLNGELPAFCAELDGRLARDSARPAALLPGAFNPVHQGH